MNEVEGYIVRGKGDYASNSIFFPLASKGNGTSFYPYYDGYEHGCYWSSVPRSDWKPESSLNHESGCLYFTTKRHVHSVGSDYRSYGMPVRPVQGFTK